MKPETRTCVNEVTVTKTLLSLSLRNSKKTKANNTITVFNPAALAVCLGVCGRVNYLLRPLSQLITVLPHPSIHVAPKQAA